MPKPALFTSASTVPGGGDRGRDRRVGVDVERERLRDVEIVEHLGPAGGRDDVVPALRELDGGRAAEPASNIP